MAENNENPEVRLPLDEFVRGIAREAARTVIDEHRAACPIGRVDSRVGALERSKALLVGIILGGSGVASFVGNLFARLF